MLNAKGLEAAARKLRNAEKEKFGSWPDADDSKSIAAAAVTAYLQAVGPEPAVKDDETVVEALRDFVAWVDTWVSNPVGAYSVDALNGLFGMARDRIAALAAKDGRS